MLGESEPETTFTAVSLRDGEISLNATRVAGLSGVNAEEITQAEILERRNVMRLLKLMKEKVPAFRDARHEFFHYIEQRDNMRVNEMLPKVVTFRFLGLQRKATILTLSEVAAHSFSKELLRLPHYPYLYDKLYALSL
jgi:predicted ribosome quality control (RQC) complex YloA/Tae2 family protein